MSKKISNEFDINQSVRQVCVLCPLLSNIFIVDLTRRPGYTMGRRPGYTMGRRPGYTMGRRPGYTMGRRPGYTMGRRPGYTMGRPGYTL